MILLLLATLASAETATMSKKEAQEFLGVNGSALSSWSLACDESADTCRLDWTQKSTDPLPNPAVVRADKVQAIRDLAQKWKTVGLTSAEKDQLLKKLVMRFLEMD